MREEKRKRARDEEFSVTKKRRDDSPSAHYPTPSTSASKSRSHIPVSERQQFALLKLMETKNSPTDRNCKQAWEVQEREICESEKSPSSSLPVQASKGQSTPITQTRYGSPLRDQVEKLAGNHSHLHCHHNHGHSSSSSSSHHSGSRKSASQQQQRLHRTSNASESPLMRASKKGDLLTLKMMVKEGADVNEQDANGRTALHESSLHNFLHVVSYLLKHNANPNVRAVPRAGGTGTGDTPLHEASREGHIRIIRALLRYGADPKICNNNGERPTDICPNEAIQIVSKQVSQLRDCSGTTNTSTAPTISIRKASIASTSKSPPGGEGHHQSRSSFAEDQGSAGGSTSGGCIKRRSSPDPPNSSPSSAQIQQCRASNSPHPHPHHHHHHHRHHSPSAVRRNTVSGPPPSIGALCGSGGGSDTFTNINQLSRLSTTIKKDPYAFDDEEVELTSQSNQEKVMSAASCSSSPTQSHRFGTATAVSSTLYVNTTTRGDSLHSDPSSTVSPGVAAGVGGGPPLKLRFAVEAGHYTLMENQESSLDQSVANTVPVTTIIDVTPKQQQQEEEGVVITKVEEPNHASSKEANLMSDSVEQKMATISKDMGDRESDEGRSPKVPPLRIKLGSTTPPLPQPHQALSSLQPDLQQIDVNTTTTSNKVIREVTEDAKREDDSDYHSIAVESQPQPKLESPNSQGEVKLEEGGQVVGEMPTVDQDELTSTSAGEEEKKSVDSSSTSMSHQMKRTFGGKVSKVSLNESKDTKRHTTVTTASETIDVKSKDLVVVKMEDIPKTRSFRTLRSHTAALREKEERGKSSDVAPLKKRRYRSKGGSGSGGGSGAETGGGDADTGKSTDHEDAGNANEASSSLRSNSTNGDTVMAGGTVEEEFPSPAGDTVSGNYDQSAKSVRVFDDPSKPNTAGWGENPYEKAAELNRGLSEFIGKLVELQPKEPAGYQDYLLVTRDYLLSGNIPQHITRRPHPPELPPALVELFEEQEDERYAQALKHQSEREQLRLCAEQSVLRAQTRATIALANQPRPLSFCSVLALKGFTYLPPFKDPEHRDEESVRDRFKARTLIGWLQDIKDNFNMEKKKLLCRQLHETESLMMVQKLDWEVKLKELHLYDYRANIFDQIPSQHVPIISVPSDFPLFVHDPIQRPS